MALAVRKLRNADDANDAVQETFVKAFRAIRTLNPDRPIRPWLARICTNCCIDFARSRRRDTQSLDALEFMLESGEVAADAGLEQLEADGKVRAAVSRLPETYRKIIFLRHFRNMEVNEIAEMLNKPEGTIKSWLFRARNRLRRELTLAAG